MGVCPDYYNITWGEEVFPIYHNITGEGGGWGGSWDSKFVLRNMDGPLTEMLMNVDEMLNFVLETTKRHIKTLAYFRMSGIDIIILCQLRELALMSSFSGIERGQCYLF